ncbi:MAG: Na/Pi cotransporter family protein [Chitinophagaceae bacterium]|nr:Na/Pi cotransporter family protein [Chitinophagaceae bacterium]MCB9047091.1 Na/Pi cotransporter family protein [Chitinophagales bacterium]
MNYSEIEVWPLLAGLGLFLFGMYMLEEALKALSGRAFKKFLSKHTGNAVKAVLSGALVTAVLQSSSMVSLLVMSFTGAGIIGLKNGIGMVFGANIGTTITGWLISLLGFKVDIKELILPFIAVGGLGISFLKTEKLAQFSKFLMGFSLMFLGLDFMKSGFTAFAQHFDFGFMDHLMFGWFVVAGVVLTAAIQSSSAAMMIFLSSLAAGIITLQQGMFLAIGADLGTTITAVLGTINGNAIKKKVGWSQVYINIITAIVALSLINVFRHLLVDILGIHDPLIALVSFHTLFNTTAIVVMLPFISLFTKAIDRLIGNKRESMATLVARVNPKESHAAIEALKKEAITFARNGIAVNKAFYGISNGKNSHTVASYFDLKKYEADITKFYLKLMQNDLNEKEVAITDKLIRAIRDTTLSVKDTKDIRHNLAELEQSANDHLYAFSKEIMERQRRYYNEVELVLNNIELTTSDDINNLEAIIRESHVSVSESIIRLDKLVADTDIALPGLLNMVREINNSDEYLLKAVAHLVASV